MLPTLHYNAKLFCIILTCDFKPCSHSRLSSLCSVLFLGTEDIRANDSLSYSAKRGQRARSEAPDMFPRIFDDLPTSFTQDPSTRIHAPGYRYLPVSQETYGSAPRLSCRAPSPAPASYNSYVPRYSRKWDGSGLVKTLSCTTAASNSINPNLWMINGNMQHERLGQDRGGRFSYFS